ncbi:MAG: hypothetical protein HY579_12795 [Nitrospinae bacterium]|nr:hypothetical protein [Nitrospinota bacterium]
MQVEDSIKHSILKNGFPGKIVRLPFRPVYDSCKRNNASLSQVLENLAREDIVGKIKGDFIEFRSGDKPEPVSESSGPDSVSGEPGAAGLDALPGHVGELMAKMTPEQIAEIRKLAENMSDEDKKNILNMISQKFKPL